MKKLIPKIIFVVLIMILILSIIFVINQKQTDLVKQMYKNISEKSSYSFSMEEENSEINYKLIISKYNESICIDAYSNDDHTTTLVTEKEAYYIMHNQKEYYEYDGDSVEADILKTELAGIDKKEYSSGHEKINGKQYYYEEYDDISTFIMWSNYNVDNSKLKTRFYFSGDKICYIKTTIDDKEEELLKVEFTEDVDKNLFQIPQDYAESGD